ncbi:uncharacterized protein [Hyperolius riggenbachi]
MGPTDLPEVVKLQRTQGDSAGLTGTTTDNLQLRGSGILGQFRLSLLCQETGRHESTRPPAPDISHHVMVRGQSGIPVGSPHTGDSQQTGRFSKQTANRGVGVGTQSRNVFGDYKTLGGSNSRFVRKSREHKGARFLYPGSFCFNEQIGCPINTLAKRVALRIPSIQINTKGPQEDSIGGDRSDTNSPLVAKESLVPATAVPSGSGTLASSIQSGSAITGRQSPSESRIVQSDCLDPEEQMLTVQGFSKDVVNTLLACRKPTTRRKYNKVWYTFSAWKQKDASRSDDITSVLEFLQQGVKLGLTVSTLRAQVSALSVFLSRRLSADIYVKNFLRSVERSQPIPQKLVPPWDLSLVLDFLTSDKFEPLDSVPLKFLTLKVVFLVAITSARRIGDIQALSIKDPYMIIHSDKIVFRLDPSYLPKVSTSFHRTQDIVLPSFLASPQNDKERRLSTLDVRRAVLTYLERTREWRVSTNLFVAFGGVKRGSHVSKMTVSRWIRQLISLAYSEAQLQVPDHITAHSTRSLSASWAERSGASLEQICRAATWSSHSTFIKHYRVELLSSQDQAFGRKVLQAVIPP